MVNESGVWSGDGDDHGFMCSWSKQVMYPARYIVGVLTNSSVTLDILLFN